MCDNLGTGLLLLAMRSWRGESDVPAPNFVPLIALACVSVACVLENHACSTMEEVPRKDPFQRIAFVERGSGFVKRSFVEEAMSTDDTRKRHSISALFTCCARIRGVRPQWNSTVSDAVDSGADVVVVFAPKDAPSREDFAALRRLVAANGTILIVDDLRNAQSSQAKAWCQPFGLSLVERWDDAELFEAGWRMRLDQVASVPQLAAIVAAGSVRRLSQPTLGAAFGTVARARSLAVGGGTPMLVDELGVVLAASRQVGGAYAVAFSAGSCLTDAVLGSRVDLSPSEAEIVASKVAVRFLEMILRRSVDLPIGEEKAVGDERSPVEVPADESKPSGEERPAGESKPVGEGPPGIEASAGESRPVGKAKSSVVGKAKSSGESSLR